MAAPRAPWTKGERLWVRSGREPGLIFVVRKRLGNAVRRNRIKRRLRHVCRLLHLAADDCLVVLVQPPATISSFQGLRDELTRLVAELHADDTVSP